MDFIVTKFFRNGKSSESETEIAEIHESETEISEFLRNGNTEITDYSHSTLVNPHAIVENQLYIL